MNNFNMMVALVGAVPLLLGLGSKWLAASPLPPTLVALGIGIALGPEGFGLIDLQKLGEQSSILEKAARLTLGISLVGVALRIPRVFIRRNWREMLVLIGLGMLLMWAISTVLVYLILGLPFWLAALIGAIVTPTDPVASSPIVTGSVAEENIPDRLRNAISFESGANDGLGYLFVFLPFLMLTRPAGEALSHWVLPTFLWDIGMATALGPLIGYTAAKLLQGSERHGAIQSDWRLIYTAALALFAIGAGRLIGSDEVLVAFAAGAAFTQVVSASERDNEEQGQEAINRFFVIPIIVLLGTALPWKGWFELGWSGVILAVAVLLLRRPPVLLLLRPLLPGIRGVPDALFLGWFGPVAVAAIYYASMMEHKLGNPVIWHVVSLVICSSILAHGVTGAPLTRLFGRKAGKRSARKGADQASSIEAAGGRRAPITGSAQ
ncbi:cation:proton antiporter [Microvirga splendida]|uniref:Cation:proton antiporter n=1 Tax=Microvirga splendida TaxID=2795727 RepID=A0ABS0Y054_9HYPH|nr:cation:proton antiporter [Microvirga splendida]MBJ6125663.1 cation:proton antiporter [Microvirga splendida]